MKKANVPELIVEFSDRNRELLEAMRLFEISNAEYERAVQALAPPTTITAVSTGGYEDVGYDGVVE